MHAVNNINLGMVRIVRDADTVWYKLTIKGNFFIGEQLEHLVVDDGGLPAALVALGQQAHHLGGRLVRVSALRGVRGRLVRRTAPAAADAREAAAADPARHDRSTQDTSQRDTVYHSIV